MAINPNLVSIIPASELPTGVPTTAGQFFFYEGNEMKKSPMSEIYGIVSNSKSIGTITPSSTIPTDGNVWGFAGEGTYPNAGNITVAVGKFAILSRVGTTWSKVEVALQSGKSAYEVAVANGFVGTEAEWLISLKHNNWEKFITIYDEGSVTVDHNIASATLTVKTTEVMPVLFDKDTSHYMQIVGNQTFTVNSGNFLVLSKSNSQYIKPDISDAPGTQLYFWQLGLFSPEIANNPIIIGYLSQHYWESRFFVFDLSALRFSKWRGEIVNVDGDSLWDEDEIAPKVSLKLGCSLINRAQSGSGYLTKVNDLGTSTMLERASLITSGKAVILSGGTNDYGTGKTLGTKATYNDTNTFYGAVFQTLKIIKENNPLMSILVCTPLPRNYMGSEPRFSVNINGDSLDDFCQALIWCAGQFGATVCDLNKESGWTYENLSLLTRLNTTGGIPDQLHPNNLGGELASQKVVYDMNRMIKF